MAVGSWSPSLSLGVFNFTNKIEKFDIHSVHIFATIYSTKWIMFQHVCCCITINSLLRNYSRRSNISLLLVCVQWSLSCKHTLSILPSCPPFLQVFVTILSSVKSNNVPLPPLFSSFILLLSQTAQLSQCSSVTRQFKCQTRLKKYIFIPFIFLCLCRSLRCYQRSQRDCSRADLLLLRAIHFQRPTHEEKDRDRFCFCIHS